MKEVQELVGIVPWTFVAQICNLFLTVFLVKKFLFDRINKVVEERKQMADSQIADATKAKEEAKTMRDQYEASISNAKDEARSFPMLKRVLPREVRRLLLTQRRKQLPSRKRHLLISPRSALLHSSR